MKSEGVRDPVNLNFEEIMQKCLLQFKSAHDAAEQEFYAEGLTAKLAKTKAVEKLLKQTFGPDMSKKHDREITSIKAIKPFNRNGDQDPPLPSSCKESHLDDCIPGTNVMMHSFVKFTI